MYSKERSHNNASPFVVVVWGKFSKQPQHTNQPHEWADCRRGCETLDAILCKVLYLFYTENSKGFEVYIKWRYYG